MGTVILDAGVVIAMLERADAHHAAARDAIRQARARDDRLVIPASAYSEVLVHPSRRGQSEVDIADAAVDALPARVLPIDRETARSAASLRASTPRRLRLPDAMVLACAVSIGADRVMTTDRRLAGHGVAVELIGTA
jgi:predicted nucleic acid-binding protein